MSTKKISKMEIKKHVGQKQLIKVKTNKLLQSDLVNKFH